MGDLYQLPSITVSAGSSESVPLKDLPTQRRGRIPHVTRFICELDFTPTTTALPTTVGNNNVFKTFDFWDGKINRFVGGFNEIRCNERFNTGGVRIPDGDTDVASGSARYVRRILHLGPPQGVGGLADFAMPTGSLQSGELRTVQGALTDLAADCTAVSGTLRIFADLEPLDEVRVPPAYQVMRYALNSSDAQLPGRALLVNLMLLNSGSFDAITAGDFGSIKLDLGAGEVVQSVPAAALTAAYHDDFAPGDFSFAGEPRAAGDDNNKAVNRASPTALTAGAVDLQPVYWHKPGKKLSKCELAETGMRLSWSGTQTSGVALLGRILPQPPNIIGSIGGAACTAVKRTMKNMRVKTVSKRDYAGPFLEFMPWVIKV